MIPLFRVAGVHEEEDHNPNDFPPVGIATASMSYPASGAEFSAILWGEDSDEGSAGETPVQLPHLRFGTTDPEGVEGGAALAVLHGLVSSPCGSDDSGDHNGVSAPVPSTRWGDDNDDEEKDDRNRGSEDHLVTPSRPSSFLMPAAAGDVDEHSAEEAKRSQDGQESLQEGLQEEQGSHAATSWGSDDEDDTFDLQPPGLSQPCRMGAVAAGVATASTGARSALLPMSATQAPASWGRDGEEEGGGSGSDGDPFSPMMATLTDVNAQRRLSPGRHHRHHHRGDSDVSDEVVVAPWMLHARGRSGLVDEPNHSWADESGDDEDDTGPRRTDNLNRILMGGVHAPARNATAPPPAAALDDVDIATDDGEISPQDGYDHPAAAAAYPGQASTPSTTAPSSWFSALGRQFGWKSPAAGRGDGGGDDDSRRYPWDFQPPLPPPTTTPSHGDPLLGRWSRPKATDAAPPRSTFRAATENSPMHEALTRGDTTNTHRSPALSPVRSRRSWFRREKADAVGPRRARRDGKDGGEKGGDDGSGVRAWGWRDSLKNAPGLVGRLGVCILAVCALWLTSLSVVGESDKDLNVGESNTSKESASAQPVWFFEWLLVVSRRQPGQCSVFGAAFSLWKYS